MKKNKVIGLGLALMLGLSLIGCQGNNKSNGNSGGSQKKQESSRKTEKKENSKNSGKVTVDTSWYENDGNAISSGIFVVGESLKAGNYTFTAKRNHSSDTSAIVAVFESLINIKNILKRAKNLSAITIVQRNAYLIAHITINISGRTNHVPWHYPMVTC